MTNPTLDSIRRKVEAGDRLSAADGEFLFDAEVDLHAIGELADAVRRRKNANAAYYNINAHLNPTNVCLYRCPLCAYSRDAADADAYVMGRDEILARGREAAQSGATEMHVVGGSHPSRGLDWYLEILATLREACPRLHLKAWTAAEIAWFAESAAQPIEGILGKLVAAGLGSLPGGGAEIFDREIRRQIAPASAMHGRGC